MGIKVVATNRKAKHDYSIIDKYESGMVLTGSEIKSIRNSRVTIKQAYVRIYSNELYIVGMNISDYENAGYASHEPDSDRKLLMHKREILKIKKMVDEKGKKKWDKRRDIKDRETKRRIDRNLKDKL